MAKTNWNKKLRQGQQKLLSQIDDIFDSAAREASVIGASLDIADPDRLFSFSDYPQTKVRVNRMLQTVKTQITAVITNGIGMAWTLANNKNNELVRQVFGSQLDSLSEPQRNRYMSTNETARDAFVRRKDNGLRLSDNVWRYTNQFKTEIELALDLGIRQGLSADIMSRQVRQYLRNPDALFRRVRNEHGQLVLSRAARAYHPGRGVYRSAYKNARRLTATESNMAYRLSDHHRWSMLDFVVGIHIAPSETNHVPDICDDLAGDYPKDFVWVGWHPHCRCHALSILKTQEEMRRDNKRIAQGLEPLEDSVNTVTDVPDAYKDWVRENADRAVNRWKSRPYFMTDNPKYTDMYVAEGLSTMWNKMEGVNIKKIIGKNDPKAFRQVKSVIMNFARANPHLFPYGLKDVIEIEASTGFMSYDRAKGILSISSDGWAVEKHGKRVRRFYPSRELGKAFNAIQMGRKLTFNQEYALESLWHEICHAQAKGWGVIGNVTNYQVNAMEMLNQFHARHTYPKMIRAFGGEAKRWKAVMRDGYGYRVSIRNFNALLKEMRMSPTVAHNYFQNLIMDTNYENIQSALEGFIASRGKMTSEKAAETVRKLFDCQADDFKDYLAKLNIRHGKRF